MEVGQIVRSVDQSSLLLPRKRAARRVLEVGHQPACLGLLGLQDAEHAGEIYPLARVSWHLDGLEPQPFERLQCP